MGPLPWEVTSTCLLWQVRAVHWEAKPIANTYVTRPHYIDVDVAPDNKTEPADLPLAPWC